MTKEERILTAIKALQDTRDYADEVEAGRLTMAIELLLDLLEEQDDKAKE